MTSVEKLKSELTIKAKGLQRLYKDMQYYEKELLGYTTNLATEQDDEKCRILRLQIGENERTQDSLRQSISSSMKVMESLLTQYKTIIQSDNDDGDDETADEIIKECEAYQLAHDAYHSMRSFGFEVNGDL